MVLSGCGDLVLDAYCCFETGMGSPIAVFETKAVGWELRVPNGSKRMQKTAEAVVDQRSDKKLRRYVLEVGLSTKNYEVCRRSWCYWRRVLVGAGTILVGVERSEMIWSGES
jgi:hypothetical protein